VGICLAATRPRAGSPPYCRVAMREQSDPPVGKRGIPDGGMCVGVCEGFSPRGTNVVPQARADENKDGSVTSGGFPMKGPAKHRLHDDEAGWFTLLLQMRVASEKELHVAEARVAQESIDKMEAKRRSRNRRHRGRE